MKIKRTLDEIENRIRALIENHFLHFSDHRQLVSAEQITKKLVAAMENDAEHANSANPVAPDIYTLRFHPSLREEITFTPSFLSQLGFTLEKEGGRAGFRFNAPIRIQLKEDRSLPPYSLDITGRVSSPVSGETEPMFLDDEVLNDEPKKAFFIDQKNKTIPLTRPVINIGRHPDNDLILNDPHVSRFHAQMRIIQGQYRLFDLNSTGGTYVNRQRITEHTLKTGDVVTFSGISLIYGHEYNQMPGETQEYTLNKFDDPDQGTSPTSNLEGKSF